MGLSRMWLEETFITNHKINHHQTRSCAHVMVPFLRAQEQGHHNVGAQDPLGSDLQASYPCYIKGCKGNKCHSYDITSMGGRQLGYRGFNQHGRETIRS